MLIFRIVFPLLALVSFCKEEGHKFKASLQEAGINKQIKVAMKRAADTNDDVTRSKSLGQASSLLVQKGDYERAAHVAQQALRAKPTQFDALASMGAVYLQKGQINEAIHYLHKSIKNNARNAEAAFYLGNAYQMAGNNQKAIESYLRAIKYSDLINSYVNLAALHMQNKKPNQALDLLKVAIKKKPGFSILYRNAGIAAEQSGNKREAIKYYRKYVKLAPFAEDSQIVSEWVSRLEN